MAIKEFIKARQEMEQLLREQVIGFLGLSVGGNLYVVPLNYAYVDGRIIFHCALTGKKLDYIRANPDVCFTVAHQSGQVRRHGEGDPCHLDSDSVICYGKARIIENPRERRAVLNDFNRSFNPDAERITLESAEKCGAVVIDVTEMTGRREREHETTYWRHTFGSQT
jgi:nitroimidazol reductase NimA-like FMN-containing flavoprotein (pyridoxamine 5'-phosphate oxidase superfamily)